MSLQSLFIDNGSVEYVVC